jgi:hypothetical protein
LQDDGRGGAVGFQEGRLIDDNYFISFEDVGKIGAPNVKESVEHFSSNGDRVSALYLVASRNGNL